MPFSVITVDVFVTVQKSYEGNTFTLKLKVFLPPNAASASSRSSNSGLSIKRLISTLNDIIYYLFVV
jgi:hypothetical protein